MKVIQNLYVVIRMYFVIFNVNKYILADRADFLTKAAAIKDSTILELKNALASQTSQTEECEKKLIGLQKTFDKSENMLKSANSQIAQLLEETDAQCSVLKIKDSELDHLKRQQVHSGKVIEDISKQLRISKENDAARAVKEQESQIAIEMQSEQCKELEVRLEQAIMRWYYGRIVHLVNLQFY